MFSWLFGSGKSKCAICAKKAIQPRKYYNQEGKPIKVCANCVSYAERRAFPKR